MIISHALKFIYLANGKTGSTSIYSILSKYNECRHKKHSTLEEVDFNISRYYTFCFVRNPWDRMTSIYNQWRKPVNLKNQARKHCYEIASGSFTEFIKSMRDEDWKSIAQKNYYLFDNKIISNVGKFENLNQDYSRICEAIGIEPEEIPKLNINSSKSKPYQNYYDEQTISIVAKHSLTDIELFEYKFEQHS
tara:strand:- start:367 stop:942 length:576 start_codon:yes stop_codon:yes gene_type:complete